MDFFNGDPIQSSILVEFYLHLDHSFLQIQKPIACPFNSSLKCTVGVHPVFDGCDSGITIDWSLSDMKTRIGFGTHREKEDARFINKWLLEDLS